MTIDKDYIINDLGSNSTFYDWFIKENTEIIEKLNMLKVFNIEGVNGITAPVATNGVASIGLSGKVDDGISFNGPAYFNNFAAIPNIAVKVPQINSTVGGFTFGTPVRVYFDTDTNTIKYEGARANDQDQAEVMGVVSSITSTHAYVTLLGKIDGNFSQVNTRGIGLTAGWIYFVDPGITGNITDIEPVTTGQVSKPIIMGISGDSGLVLQMRGNYLAGVTTDSQQLIVVLETFLSVYDTSHPDYVDFEPGRVVSLRTVPSNENTAFTTELTTYSDFNVRLANSNTNERTYLYLSITNKDGAYLNTAENDIFGLILSRQVISNKIYYTILTYGYTDSLNGLSDNGLYYLNPDWIENGTDIVGPQYGIEFCSSGVLLFNKLASFSLFSNSRVAPCTSGFRSTDSFEPSNIKSTYNYLVNGNFNVWQRNTGKNTADTSIGNLQFADMWRRHDGITGISNSKDYYIIRRNFNEYQTEIEGNPEYYLDIKALGLSAIGLSGTSGGYTAYDHLMIGHVVPGAKKFDSNYLNVNFYAKSSSSGYDVDVYLSRYSGTDLLDYTKIGTANLTTSWNKYSYSYYINPLTNNGIPLDIDSDYSEIGVDLIPLIERANLNGVTLGQDVYVSLASFSASINSTSTSVYPEYVDQLRYCQQFYYSTYDKDQTIGSLTMTDVTTPTQNTESIFILPNKICNFYKWPVQMRATPSVSIYSPMSGILNRAYNKTASTTSVQLDTINTSGVGGRNGQNATITPTSSTHGSNICINNGIINYDEVYFHIIADADFNI
jgi:hypothetical protein